MCVLFSPWARARAGVGCGWHREIRGGRRRKTFEMMGNNSVGAPALFVVAAHVPTLRTCSQLAHTVGSIFRFHSAAHILVVDNDSPPHNVRASMSYFLTHGFADRLHITARQAPSRGQLGAWLIAHALLTRATHAAAQTPSSGAQQVFLDSEAAIARTDRVVLLQHSTPLKYPLPPPPHARCLVGSLAGHKRRQFYVQCAHRLLRHPRFTLPSHLLACPLLAVRASDPRFTLPSHPSHLMP